MKKGIPYNQGKRSKKVKRNLIKKGSFFTICIIILVFFLVYKLDLVASKKETTKEEDNVINTVEIEENVTKNEEVQIDLPNKLGNYTVIGQLVIDKIGIKKEILDRTEDASLDLSVTKFYGPSINEKRKFLYNGT